MADVVWVVESAERGGSLVTANFAKDYNSHLVASPGDIHKEASQGRNRLIEIILHHFMKDLKHCYSFRGSLPFEKITREEAF